MARYEVSHCDVVGGMDGLVAESQVASRKTAGLLGVILEICLDIFVRVVANDLNGVLVRAHCTVGAESPELAGDRGIVSGHEVLSYRQ